MKKRKEERRMKIGEAGKGGMGKRKKERNAAMEKGKCHHGRFSCGERETSIEDTERKLEGFG